MQTFEAIDHGAITVVNAMATGRGAALGISLWTKAKVTLTDNPGKIKVRILSEPQEDTSLVQATVMRTLRKYSAEDHYGAVVETKSNIPIAVGLKSSSAASNAVAAATLAALGHPTRGLEPVHLAVESSLEARVTLTGAFDDACACYFGGLIVTNNRTRKILKSYQPSHRGIRILLYVPNMKRYSGKVHQNAFKEIDVLANLAHHEALEGRYLLSLTLNGIAYSKALDYDMSPVTDALHAGALAAGLSGKGPAIAAVVPKGKIRNVLSAWKSYSGSVIETSFNFEKATVCAST